MERNKVITYSLLAHINNSGLLLNDLLAIFEPLVKRVLSSMNAEGITSGKNISEIKSRFDDAYKLELPLPVLRNILFRIAHDVNKDGKVHLQVFTNDSSFIIHNFFFLEFEEIIQEKEKEISELESAFKEFCAINSLHEENYSTIFDFIECNKLSLAQYLSVPGKFQNPNIDFDNEAKFVDFFKGFPSLFKKIRDIYLGSIISSYLEFKTSKANSDLEIIFDTNYILSLLDLNSEEAYKTCKTLLDILKVQGVKLKVMDLTIVECQNLLEKKAEYFDTVFLQKNINSEDIYNACERRRLTKTDLELISSNLESALVELGINVIPNTTKYQNIAKFSPEFESLRKVRNIDFAALHDATAIHYVRDKRGKQIKDFDKVNCWFVNNSSNLNFFKSLKTNGFQPEAIKAEDLLNILWLSNPNILNALKSTDLIDIGITRLISCTLNDSFPRASVLRDFEENIQKYAPMELSDKDIIRIASRVANKALSNIDELNVLAESNQKAFVERLKKEAAIEKAREEKTSQKLKEFIDKLNQKQTALDKLTSQADEKIKTLDHRSAEVQRNEELVKQRERESDEKVAAIASKYESEKRTRISLMNQKIAEERRRYIAKRVFRWRLITFGYLFFGLVIFVTAILYVYFIADWKNEKAMEIFEHYKGNLIAIAFLWVASVIFTGFFIKRFSDQFSASNLNAFKLTIERGLPANLKDVTE